jgi:two-component system, OmpR family, response regulator CpxR
MPSSRSPGRILIVEDNLDARETLADLLDVVGYAIDCAANGLEALAHLERGPGPALILLDLMMPVMDGWTLMQCLQQNQNFAAIPVVVLSAVADAQQHRELPAAAVLPKPISIDKLMALVVRFCGLPDPDIHRPGRCRDSLAQSSSD